MIDGIKFHVGHLAVPTPPLTSPLPSSHSLPNAPHTTTSASTMLQQPQYIRSLVWHQTSFGSSDCPHPSPHIPTPIPTLLPSPHALHPQCPQHHFFFCEYLICTNNPNVLDHSCGIQFRLGHLDVPTPPLTSPLPSLHSSLPNAPSTTLLTSSPIQCVGSEREGVCILHLAHVLLGLSFAKSGRFLRCSSASCGVNSLFMSFSWMLWLCVLMFFRSWAGEGERKYGCATVGRAMEVACMGATR